MTTPQHAPQTADSGIANGIDPRSPRFGAAITTVLLAVTIVLTLVPATYVAGLVLLTLIVALFAIGGLAGIRRHPYGALFRRFVRPRLAPPTELEAPEPPTFAQQVGLFVTAVALLLALLGVPYAAPIGAAVALVAAFLNAVFDVCIGCILYVWLVRAGVFRQRRTTA
ncbi:DUF4395 domain-containing protein [Curtobacterium sp. ISL-83]|uniref:DUF4395 domain-containing protein n=1 Tax=Curtobacterium sp. ISL-83 TaxID=2819145 RepID=UPI001BED1322|nr:DUF4395 domain-containing protein [Curtobacterium sp. ISL-83]MBT2500959.1 DUF4395 domain-containing protein [Curtobacterium sp. ISL-83]